jgi:hypothetical protein
MTDGPIPCSVELSAGASAIRATAGPAQVVTLPLAPTGVEMAATATSDNAGRA